MLKVSGLLNERMFGKQEPIKRGPDGQWLEDNQGHGAEPPQPVPGANAYALGGVPARLRLPGHDVRQSAGAVPRVAADAVAGADEQPAGDAHVQGVRAGSAGEEPTTITTKRSSLAFDMAYNRPPTAKEQEIAKKIHRGGDGSAGRPAPVHPGDVRGQQFPVQLLGAVESLREKTAMKRFLTRRQALQEAAVGFGAMAVNSMLQQERLFAAESASPRSGPTI